MRKTVRIVDLIAKANHILAASVDEIKKEREGIAFLVESILHDHGAYNGFNYLTKAQLKGEAKTPGIDHCCTNEERLWSQEQTNIDPWFLNCDQTRKAFHVKK